MPDQRMHDLRINSESARSHKSCEVHGIRLIDRESVCVLDGREDAEKLTVIRHRRPRVGRTARRPAAPVESSPFVENDGRGTSCHRARGTAQSLAEQTSASRLAWRLHDRSSSNVQSGTARPTTACKGIGPKYRPSSDTGSSQFMRNTSSPATA